MPIIKSAKKRMRVTEKQSIQNSKTKRSLRESIKAFQASLKLGKDTTKAQAEAYSAIDTAVKKGVISKNRAARKKSQLNSASKAAGTTKAGTKRSPQKKSSSTTGKAKSPAKPKAAVKKPVAKKTSVKKAPSTKTTAKKVPTKKK